MRQYNLSKQNAEKRSWNIKNRILSVILLISFFMFVSSAIRTSKKIRQIDEEADIREKEYLELQKKEAELKAKYEEITSEEYMEKQLRNQLNMAKENEIILILPPDEVLVKLVPKDEVTNEVDTIPNWRKWATLFGLYK